MSSFTNSLETVCSADRDSWSGWTIMASHVVVNICWTTSEHWKQTLFVICHFDVTFLQSVMKTLEWFHHCSGILVTEHIKFGALEKYEMCTNVVNLEVVCCCPQCWASASAPALPKELPVFHSWSYSDIRAAAEAVMRRCHEEVGQDDLGADALLRHHSAGSHGWRGLCQVEQCHEQAEGTETEGKWKFRLNTEPIVLPPPQGICPAISWAQVLR